MEVLHLFLINSIYPCSHIFGLSCLFFYQKTQNNNNNNNNNNNYTNDKNSYSLEVCNNFNYKINDSVN